MRRIFRGREEGQAIVEFALVLVILVILLCVPIDLFRYINMRSLLCSAATESLAQIQYSSVQNNSLAHDIRDIIEQTYGDRFDVGMVTVAANHSGNAKEEYTYYVYSSALAQTDPAQYWNQFEARPASYSKADIELQLSAEFRPVTFWGAMLLGDTVTVETPSYHMAVYAGGYVP